MILFDGLLVGIDAAVVGAGVVLFGGLVVFDGGGTSRDVVEALEELEYGFLAKFRRRKDVTSKY